MKDNSVKDNVEISKEIFVFYENKKIKAIYTDKNTTKLLYNKILGLFDPEHNYMDSMGYCWNLLKLKQNHMYDKVDTPGYKTKFTQLNIKGFNIGRRDLDRDLDYINLTQFY